MLLLPVDKPNLDLPSRQAAQADYEILRKAGIDHSSNRLGQGLRLAAADMSHAVEPWRDR
jgi:hypothetical protein